jgi:pimeloyl-ACP methyl ester carboxylesterase
MTISQNKYFKLNFLSIFMLAISLNACDDGSEPINDPIMAIRTSSGTEMAGTEMAGTEMAGTEIAGTEMAGTEMAGTEMAGTEMAGTEMAGTEMAGTEMAGTEMAGTEMAGTEMAGTEMAGTEMAGTDLIPTDGDLTITYSGSASGPLVVAAFTSWPPIGPPISFEQEASPTYPVSISFPQLDAGTYTILAFIDVDESGSMSPTDADIQARVEVQWPTESAIEINLDGEDPLPIEELEVVNDTVNRGVRMTPVSALVPIGTEPLPMIVFTPGFQLQASYYAPMLESLAQEGYIVILADPPGTLFDVNHIEMAADVRAVIDWAINSNFSTRIDVNKIATMGHSLGGKLALFNAAEDERVVATLALDPVDGDPSPLPDPSIRPTLADDILGRITGAVGLIGELSNAESQNIFSPACAPRANNFQTIYAALTNASWLVEWELIGADHMDFVSACPDGLFSPCSACEEGSMMPDRVINLSTYFASAFFALHLRGEDTRNSELISTAESDVNVRQR